jgi:hypothetical protein
MPINPKSSWPFTPFLLANVLEIEKAVKLGHERKPLVAKTIERFFRAGARVMEHYGIPADQALAIARAQIMREGGPVARKQLQALSHAETEKAALQAVQVAEASKVAVAGWLAGAKIGGSGEDDGKGEKGNEQ